MSIVYCFLDQITRLIIQSFQENCSIYRTRTYELRNFVLPDCNIPNRPSSFRLYRRSLLLYPRISLCKRISSLHARESAADVNAWIKRARFYRSETPPGVISHSHLFPPLVTRSEIFGQIEEDNVAALSGTMSPHRVGTSSAETSIIGDYTRTESASKRK